MTTPSIPPLRLLIQCPDRPGIVAAVSKFLFEHGANIVQADQYSTAFEGDGAAGRFFLRVEFEATGLDASVETLTARFASEVATPFAMEWRLSGDHRPRVALMASRTDHCLLELLWRWRRHELVIDIPLVISNHEALRADVEAFGLPFHVLPVTSATKAQQETAIRALLQQANVDLVVLARYMQILSGEFIAEYPARIINIHHSFLPAFAGASPYRQAFARGVKLIGATAHFVTEELDAGPIIAQDVTPVDHTFTPERMAQAGRDVEKLVLARAVRLVLEERVFLHGPRAVVFG